MRKIKESSEEEMVLAFLRSEIESERWKGRIIYRLLIDGKDKSIILNPNLKDENENKYRAELLNYRGFGSRTALFLGFPDDVTWDEYSLNFEDLRRLKTLGQDKWMAYTYGSQLAVDAVKMVFSGLFKTDEVDHILKVVKSIKNGESFPKVILVGENINHGLIILEGHVRIIAYLVNGNKDLNINCIVGCSSNIQNWYYYKYRRGA